MASYRREPVVLDDARPVLIRVGTRVAHQAERVNSQSLAQAVFCQDAQEELEDARFTKGHAPRN